MSESQPPTPPTPSDMLEAWRQAASQMEQRWNEYLNQMMGTEGFGQVMARSMDGYLTMQSTFARAMEQYLHTVNIPTRTDISQLAERLGLLEQHIMELTSLLSEPRPQSQPIDAPSRPSRSTGRNQAASPPRQTVEQ